MSKEYENGGLQAIDFDFINGTLKLNWLKSFLSKDNFWFHIPREIFRKLGGIKLLLKCDFTIQKLPIKLSLFHQQVLLYWKMLYSHNFSPHNTPIWNNRFILSKNKSIYIKELMDKGVWSVIHFMYGGDCIMSHDTFCLKHNLNISLKLYRSIIKAIPSSFMALIKGNLLYTPIITPCLPHLLVGGSDFTSTKFPNKTIRKLFNDVSYPLFSFPNSITMFFSRDIIHSLRTQYLKFPIPPKAKELHFKILNGIYPSNEFLRLRFGFDANSCVFCEDIETTEHLFFHCTFTDALWSDIHDWLQSSIPLVPFVKNDIIYGIILQNKDLDFLLNNILILCKFYIHKCKYKIINPVFSMFHNDFVSFFKALKKMKGTYATKLADLIEKYDLLNKP